MNKITAKQPTQKESAVRSGEQRTAKGITQVGFLYYLHHSMMVFDLQSLFLRMDKKVYSEVVRLFKSVCLESVPDKLVMDAVEMSEQFEKEIKQKYSKECVNQLTNHFNGFAIGLMLGISSRVYAACGTDQKVLLEFPEKE